LQYVVDANVVVKWFIPEVYSDKAARLLADFRSHRLDIIAPDILVAEVGNTLWKRSIKIRDISAADAAASYTDFLDLGVPLHSSATIAENAISIATAEQHPLYDTLYISLALKRGCEFVTADETLVNKLGFRFPLIKPLKNL
jgi:predicted nucleic acid-binding protein